ncbi:hypothetical protein EDC01DRAFT_431472 [Geopyxis carbonaria]|nr:hypothetical protein EDC01DRAFT_431472 [Geopyxis carbonaria]
MPPVDLTSRPALHLRPKPTGGAWKNISVARQGQGVRRSGEAPQLHADGHGHMISPKGPVWRRRRCCCANEGGGWKRSTTNERERGSERTEAADSTRWVSGRPDEPCIAAAAARHTGPSVRSLIRYPVTVVRLSCVFGRFLFIFASIFSVYSTYVCTVCVLLFGGARRCPVCACSENVATGPRNRLTDTLPARRVDAVCVRFAMR